jgi:hypothetical protein
MYMESRFIYEFLGQKKTIHPLGLLVNSAKPTNKNPARLRKGGDNASLRH